MDEILRLDFRRSDAVAARVAVIIPCYNEELGIGRTVTEFRAALPHAVIYVYDNNSRDGTCAAAIRAGAVVRRERQQGKGAVVRRMFADVDADVYVMADGDGTYDAGSAAIMVKMLLDDQLDMVVGARASQIDAAYRRGHRFGNHMLTGLLSLMFGRSFTDVLSGYRVFSRRFVKSFPVLSLGFEIETEISIHALELAMPTAEVRTAYGARDEGSVSKLSTFADGRRILRMMLSLYRSERPVIFFGAVAAVLLAAAALISVPLWVTYADSGLVPRMPTAVGVTGLAIVAVLFFFAGLILDTVTKGRQEMKRLVYLQLGAPASREGAAWLVDDERQRATR